MFDIRCSSFVLFTYLKMMIGNKNRAFPSLTRMMHDLGMAKSSICRCLKEQVRVGLIHMEHCLTKLGEFAENTYFCIVNAKPEMSVPRTATALKNIFKGITCRSKNNVAYTASQAKQSWNGYLISKDADSAMSFAEFNLSNGPLNLPFSILLL